MTESLSQTDGRFSKHMLNHYAPQQIFIAEGEGARGVIAQLSMPGRKVGRTDVYYADTAREQSPGFVESLRALDISSLQIFAARLELLRNVPAIFSQSSPPLHLYISAGAWFIEATGMLAEKAGIADGQITVEPCALTSRCVCCLRCNRQMMLQPEQSITCTGCGEALQITEYYRRSDHVHLAIPADWPTD